LLSARQLLDGEALAGEPGNGDRMMGDAFLSMLAGIVLGLSRGLPFRDAVHFGMAAGAPALLGSGTHLCRRNDVERLYAEPEYLPDV
jgi:hypothetical protein